MESQQVVQKETPKKRKRAKREKAKESGRQRDASAIWKKLITAFHKAKQKDGHENDIQELAMPILKGFCYEK